MNENATEFVSRLTMTRDGPDALRMPGEKIMTADTAYEWRKGLRNHGTCLVFTNGCFDLLHRGHVEYLFQARRVGGALMVAVNSDASIRRIKGPDRPIIEQQDRVFMLASLEAVDAVVVFEEDTALQTIAAIQPDIYVKGGDYTADTINQQERRLVQSMGCRIVLVPEVQGFSTTALVGRIRRTENRVEKDTGE